MKSIFIGLTRDLYYIEIIQIHACLRSVGVGDGRQAGAPESSKRTIESSSKLSPLLLRWCGSSHDKSLPIVLD